MRLIETKPIGDANFYKFSVDFIGDDFILGGKTLPLGIITHDILNIPADKLLSIFKTGDKLNALYNRLNAENYSDELFIKIRETILEIIKLIKRIKLFKSTMTFIETIYPFTQKSITWQRIVGRFH